MIPLFLFIRDFLCFETGEIDFSLFNSAILIGRKTENNRIANAVGKTSLFRAIEFCLFNQVRDPAIQKDIVLSELIRQGTEKATVQLDFAIGQDDIYRVVRARTAKGISDLSLFKRNAVLNSSSIHTFETDKALWDNLSSRRTGDTEADLAKLLKCNYKSFCSANHYMQNDLTSLASSTPEKRKAILKEALELTVYAKLEEKAKEKAAAILKTIEATKTTISSLGSPQQEKALLNDQLEAATEAHRVKAAELSRKAAGITILNEQGSDLLSKLNVLSSQSAAIISKHAALSDDVRKLHISHQEFSQKRKIIIGVAKETKAEMDELKRTQQELSTSFHPDDLIPANEKLAELTQEGQKLSIQIATLDASISENSVPLPADGTCKHCRQPLSSEHRAACEEELKTKVSSAKQERQEKTATLQALQRQIRAQEQTILLLQQKKRKLEDTNAFISSKVKEMQQQREQHDEYKALLDKFQADLIQKEADLIQAAADLKASSAKEMDEIRQQLSALKMTINQETNEHARLSQALSSEGANIAVLKHSIDKKTEDEGKKIELERAVVETEKEYAVYPSVIQAFGSTGISNLIIQNVLEDLQTEANDLLAHLKPGLQLAFSTEKERGDGSTADTLEIGYFINNKPRSILSGSQRLCIGFALKLGLSLLLNRMMGGQIGFLLMDEVDPSLDKESIDAFSEIIKQFSDRFKILVITHNDQLQERFSSAILVEQDQDMVSRASVVSSW